MKKVLIALACCVALAGCGAKAVSQNEYESVVAEREELKAKVSSLEDELDSKEKDKLSDQEGNQQSEAVEETVDDQKEIVKETSTPESTDHLEAEAEKKSDESSEEIGKGSVEILAEYTLPDSMGWYTYHLIILENKSSQTVEISTASLAYAADGTMLGAANGSLEALGAGCVSIFYEAFETDEEIDHYETELNVSPEQYYESVVQDLSYVQNDLKNGAVFQVTNNGEEAADFVEGYALFFLGEKLVGFNNTYFTDDDSEIKPGKTISKQLRAYEDFDRMEFYLTGRR